jgi:hypothetical protein
MTTQEWQNLFKMLPEHEHHQLVLTTTTNTDLTVERVFKIEPTYICFRGRMSGTIDTGRLFFVPYSQLTFFRIERIVKETEVRAIYNEEITEEMRQRDNQQLMTSAELAAKEAAAKEAAQLSAANAPTTPAPSAPAPAGNAALLEKIRAAKAASQGPSSRRG